MSSQPNAASSDPAHDVRCGDVRPDVSAGAVAARDVTGSWPCRSSTVYQEVGDGGKQAAQDGPRGRQAGSRRPTGVPAPGRVQTPRLGGGDVRRRRPARARRALRPRTPRRRRRPGQLRTTVQRVERRRDQPSRRGRHRARSELQGSPLRSLVHGRRPVRAAIGRAREAAARLGDRREGSPRRAGDRPRRVSRRRPSVAEPGLPQPGARRHRRRVRVDGHRRRRCRTAVRRPRAGLDAQPRGPQRPRCDAAVRHARQRLATARDVRARRGLRRRQRPRVRGHRAGDRWRRRHVALRVAGERRRRDRRCPAIDGCRQRPAPRGPDRHSGSAGVRCADRVARRCLRGDPLGDGARRRRRRGRRQRLQRPRHGHQLWRSAGAQPGQRRLPRLRGDHRRRGIVGSSPHAHELLVVRSADRLLRLG